MRDIRFRAWHKDNEIMGKITKMDLWSDEMDEHSFEIFADDEIIECEPDEIILMQYTGLRDKNGKEVYEGDIITGWTIEREVVEFRKAAFYPLYIFNDASKHYEVIGNIYEHPHLLGSDTE